MLKKAFRAFGLEVICVMLIIGLVWYTASSRASSKPDAKFNVTKIEPLPFVTANSAEINEADADAITALQGDMAGLKADMADMKSQFAEFKGLVTKYISAQPLPAGVGTVAIPPAQEPPKSVYYVVASGCSANSASACMGANTASACMGANTAPACASADSASACANGASASGAQRFPILSRIFGGRRRGASAGCQ